MKYLEAVISVIILRAAMYVEGLGIENSLDDFPRIKRIVGSLDGADLSVLTSETDSCGLRYSRVLSIISEGGDDVEQSVLDLCLAAMHVPEFAAYLKHHLGATVTLQLAYDLESGEFPDYSDIIGKTERLSRIFYIDKHSQPIQHYEIFGDDRLFAYITGSDAMDVRLERCCELFHGRDELGELLVRMDKKDEICEALSTGSRIIQVTGSEGRAFVAKHALREKGLDALFFDYSAQDDYSEDGLELMRMMVGREAMLRGCCVVVSGLSAEGFKGRGEQPGAFWRQFVRYLTRLGVTVILLADNKLDFSLTQTESIARIRLSPCTLTERQSFWSGFSRRYSQNADTAYMAGKYKLSPGEVEHAFHILTAAGKSVADESEFARVCFDIATAGVDMELGSVSMPEMSLDELKVDRQVKDTIAQICANSRFRLQVYEQWGLKKVFKYGRTISALFSGDPGTGKTMAAHIIASELKLPLYQVNISSVIDKYIGETEKHLERIFDFAEKTDTILFFDEADAIFGKRSEVKDSNDRYANASVSYILQRIEQYEGIVILATNLMGNIDPAFMRRIKYMISFSPPNREQRRAIWEQCLTPELETDGNIDMDYLSGQFEFSGGTIKNIIHNSCFLASSQGQPLNMACILRSVMGEYIKENRSGVKSLLGKYAYLVDD